jgi:hypothetical protein
MGTVSHLVFLVVTLEWVVWPFAVSFLEDEPKCPLCKNSFSWREIDVYNEAGQKKPRPTSFSCPRCQETIRTPSWRKSFLKVAYLASIAVFLFVTFQMPGDLFSGIIGTLLASVGAIRIADWFISRRLEPGTPGDSPGFWT